MWFTGPVPRKYPETNWSTEGLKLHTAAGDVTENVPEDAALVFATDEGLAVLTGCGRCGLESKRRPTLRCIEKRSSNDCSKSEQRSQSKIELAAGAHPFHRWRADDWASGIASVHAIRNEPDETFKWPGRAYAQKDSARVRRRR